MNKKVRWCVALAALILVVVASGSLLTATAQESNKAKGADSKRQAQEERRTAFKNALSTCKLSLGQAIAAAEADTGGKAYAAEFEMMKGGKLVADVSVIARDTMKEVHVDSDSGGVIKGTDGDDDDDDEDDDEDEDEDDDDDDDDR